MKAKETFREIGVKKWEMRRKCVENGINLNSSVIVTVIVTARTWSTCSYTRKMVQLWDNLSHVTDYVTMWLCDYASMMSKKTRIRAREAVVKKTFRAFISLSFAKWPIFTSKATPSSDRTVKCKTFIAPKPFGKKSWNFQWILVTCDGFCLSKLRS